MKNDEMCMWVGMRTCKFAYLRDYTHDFKNEYCKFCLTGQMIMAIKKTWHKTK